MEAPAPLAVVNKKTKTVWTRADIIERPYPICGAQALVMPLGKLLPQATGWNEHQGHVGFGGCNSGFEIPALNPFGQQA